MTDSSTPPPQAPKSKNSWKKPLLFGCLGILVLGCICAGIVTWWAATKGKAFVANAAGDGITQMIKELDLPEKQQRELTHEIDRLVEGLESDKISLSQMGTIMDKIGDSPLATAMQIYSAESKIIDKSGLSKAEQDEADITLHRFIFGVLEDRIPESAIDELLSPLLKNPDKRNFKFRNDVTDAELRAALSTAKAHADNAGIRKGDITPNLAREIRRIIDSILEQ